MQEKEKKLHNLLQKTIALNFDSAYKAATAVIVALNNNYELTEKSINYLDNYKNKE